MTASTTTKVLYIVGAGRSGSTLLDQMIGSLPGGLSAGELRTVFGRFFQFDRSCSCGAPLAECPLWGTVVPDVLSAHGVVSPLQLAEFQREHLRMRHLPGLLQVGLRPRTVERYGAIMGDLYEAAAGRSGAQFIVDSSKTPTDAALFASYCAVPMVFAHLVRDPRGVAASWARAVPDVETRTGLLPQQSPARSAIQWMTLNAGAEALFRSSDDICRRRVRYEDLVADSSNVVKELCTALGRKPSDDPGTQRTIGVGHLVLGNPRRFDTGKPVLSLDERWRTELSPQAQATVKAITWPLARRYGYSMSSDR